MVMYKIVNGIKVQMSSTEETARLAEEKAWNDGAFDRALDDLRTTRNKLLAESDWTQSRDVTLSNDDDWKTYRQSLRDITKDLTTVDDVDKVTWPTKPS